MESLMITPSTQPMSTPSIADTNSTKIETKAVQHAVDTNRTKHESAKEKTSEVRPEEVSKEFNDISDSLNLDVKFAYNEKINEVYINVTDKNTGRVIRKLPTEEAMKIKESMKDLVGVLFDEKG